MGSGKDENQMPIKYMERTRMLIEKSAAAQINKVANGCTRGQEEKESQDVFLKRG